MNKKQLYKMTVMSGGGTESDGGNFSIKETPKTLTFVCEREPFFSNRMTNKKKLAENVYQFVPIRINKFYNGNKPAWQRIEDKYVPYTAYMNNGHVARLYDDGEWCLYPNQCGIPHVLTPIT